MSYIRSVLALVIVMGCLLLQQACVVKEFPVTETYDDIEYKTEYQTESYAEVEKVVVEARKGRDILTPVVKWFNSLYYSGYKPIRSTYYYGYFIGPIQHSKSEVRVNLSRGVQQFEGLVKVYDLSGIGQIPQQPTALSWWGPVISQEQAQWVADINYILGGARVLGEVYMGPGATDSITFDASGVVEFAILVNSHLEHAISHVELRWTDETTEERVVTKQRQVPHQVPNKVTRQRTVMEAREVPFWELFLGQ